MKDIKQQLQELLQQAAAESGVEIQTDREELAVYTAARLALLSELVGTDYFAEAVNIERDNILLKAGIIATVEADSLDRRVLGVIEGALYIAAAALS